MYLPTFRKSVNLRRIREFPEKARSSAATDFRTDESLVPPGTQALSPGAVHCPQVGNTKSSERASVLECGSTAPLSGENRAYGPLLGLPAVSPSKNRSVGLRSFIGSADLAHEESGAAAHALQDADAFNSTPTRIASPDQLLQVAPCSTIARERSGARDCNRDAR